MRWSLAKSMLLGRYYAWENLGNDINGDYIPDYNLDHFVNRYFDEFDLDVGYPTGDLQNAGRNIWVRFFDTGVAISSFSTTDVTFSDSDLRGLPGYAGPYYRFKGGQDIAQNGQNAMNNGDQFTSVTFQGNSFVGWAGATYVGGDGIILVKSPQTAVSDIIVTNTENSTSPVSEPATLAGGFAQVEGLTVDNAPGYFAVRDWGYGGQPGFAYASFVSGEAKFTPNIGVAGQYEVFERHGTFKDGSSSASVEHRIAHAGGTSSKTVSQQQGAGEWNSLGIYRFNTGTNGNVTIYSTGAGHVMANAIMFRFVRE